MNETIDLIRRHRSIRRFDRTTVPDEHVRAAVIAGQAASTSSAVQAYSVLRITDPGVRERLVELTGGQKKVAGCGVFFVVCGDTRRHRLLAARGKRPYRSSLEGSLLAIIDATLFAQNMSLAFESMGYGICYIGGLRNRLFDVDTLLDLPEGVYPLYGLCVGTPREDPMPRPRLPHDAVLFDDRYPDDGRMLEVVDRYDRDYREYQSRRGAEASGWSEPMVAMFERPRREDLAAYYRSKGASFD